MRARLKAREGAKIRVGRSERKKKALLTLHGVREGRRVSAQAV